MKVRIIYDTIVRNSSNGMSCTEFIIQVKRHRWGMWKTIKGFYKLDDALWYVDRVLLNN